MKMPNLEVTGSTAVEVRIPCKNYLETDALVLQIEARISEDCCIVGVKAWAGTDVRVFLELPHKADPTPESYLRSVLRTLPLFNPVAPALELKPDSDGRRCYEIVEAACRNCGAGIDEGDGFCELCGTGITWDEVNEVLNER